MQENYRNTSVVVRTCEENESGENILRRMLDVDIPGKRRRGQPNLRWKDACKRDMTEVDLKRTTLPTGQH